MKQVGIGLYGINGHQLSNEMIRQAGGVLVGMCPMAQTEIDNQVRLYHRLDTLLADPDIDLVSVCSPYRSGQAEDIKKIIKAGKHVYAEKPCVMKEADLDEILQAAREHQVIFCEMSGCMFERPYNKVRELVARGILGDIVQIFVQKSYPYGDFRPQDEDVDGGLILQNGIYGARFVEHVAGVGICTVTNALETTLGNPAGGGLRMAAAMQMTLENGGIASVIANYLNPSGTKLWGNEELRIFGTRGYLKTNMSDLSVDVFTDTEQLHFESVPEEGLFARLVRSIREATEFPYSAQYLTHPTRMVLRAKAEVDTH